MLALCEGFLFTGLIALGEALVIFTGEIDISTGAMSSLSGIVMAASLATGPQHLAGSRGRAGRLSPRWSDKRAICDQVWHRLPAV